MKNFLYIILGIIAIIVFVFLAGTADRQASMNKEGAFDRAPNFSLQDYDGNIVSLSDFDGQPLVINSWAAWCPFCVDELPAFAEAQKEFGDAVTIIAIDRAEPLQTAKKYTDELGITDDLVFLLDPNDTFYRALGGFSMPETIFVDENGNIQQHKRGPMDLREIRQRIQELLKEDKS